MTPLDPKSKHIREVFARYGAALYEAQCLEKSICILLSGPHAPTPAKMTKYRFDDLLSEKFEHTLGRLTGIIREKVSLTPEVEEKLQHALEMRNWLVHSYWWDRSGSFTTSSGRDRMIQELSDLESLFEELDQFFDGLAKKWLQKKGVGQELINKEMKKYLEGNDPHPVQRRRLGKTETLINIYRYFPKEHGGKVSTPVFELSDHTFWTLCDCGLTFGPTDFDPNELHLMEEFRKALPSNINPRPKGAKPWNYSIMLANRYYIQVKCGSTDEGHAFQWGLRRS